MPLILAHDYVPDRDLCRAAGALPAPLHTCLIKCPPAAAGTIPGIQSGTRSALLKLGPATWVRLKGCGNHDQGFPLQSVDVVRYLCHFVFRIRISRDSVVGLQ